MSIANDIINMRMPDLKPICERVNRWMILMNMVLRHS